MATELERLDELLSRQEQRLRRALMAYLTAIDSPAVSAVVADLLEDGLVEDALDLLDSYVARVGEEILALWQAIGQEAATDLAELVPNVTAAIGFDVTNRRAAELIRQNRLALIVAISNPQREAIRQALYRAASAGKGPAEVARAFRNAIGLAPAQEAMVASYEMLLRNRDSSALDRALRDRRFDDKLINAIERDRPLTERQIDTMVGRYRARALAMRTENIARTEALRAFSQAREEATEQLIEQSGIDRSRMVRVWRATKDKRTRDWHRSMDRQERLMDETFVDGKGYRLRYPGDPTAPAETVINCRCTVTMRVLQPA